MVAIPKTKRNWESIFASWSQPPGVAEQERCERAEKAIKDAISSDATLAMKSVRTFIQGSYCNHTNVRQDSDVDVCVLCDNTLFYDLPEGVTLQQAGLIFPTIYKFEEYKNDVERALINKFGHKNVERGNKAFNINENSYRVDADAAPCFEYRLYYINRSGYLRYHKGTALIADDTKHRATNFPRQQYENGVEKNRITGKKFKKAVRIVKKLSNEMENNGYASAKNMSSFLIESLVWNSDNSWFNSPSLQTMTKDLLARLWQCTKEDATCKYWVEENNLKYLFHPTQKWTRANVNQFLQEAWLYIENG